MQEQNFEKQVHKLMDELVIPPSPPVWNKVEEQIRRKKDRRRIVFWLMPLLLVGTSLMWWMITNDTSRTENKINPTSIVSKPVEGKSTVETSGTDFDKNLPASPDKHSKIKFELPTTKKESFSNKIKENTIDYTKKNISHSRLKEVFKNVPVAEDNEIIIPEPETKHEITTDVFTEQTTIIKIDSAVTEQPEIETFIADSTEVVQTEQKNNEEILQDEIPGLNKKSSNWKLVPHLAIGFSNVSKGIFDPVVAADYAGIPGGTAGSGSFFPPSVPEKGMYFSAGFRIEKSINPRFQIASGLQYNYFSTHQNIGTRVVNDTTISYSNQSLRLQDYYQNGNANRYTNKYHFITIPVAIEYQLFQKIPLSLQAGVSINKLLSTNALLYNRISNIQFENEKAWNKTQLHTFSGVQYHFLKNKSFSFKAGPFIQYSITRLEKASAKKQFLSVAGLQTIFYFTSKK